MKEPLFVYISYRKKKRALKMDLASSCRTGWSHPQKGNILCTFIILFWPANLYKGTHSVFFILIEIFFAPKKKRRSRTSAWMVSSLVFIVLVSASCWSMLLCSAGHITPGHKHYYMISCIFLCFSSALVGARKSPSLGLNPINHPDRLTPKHLRRVYKVFLLFQLFLLFVMSNAVPGPSSHTLPKNEFNTIKNQ
jgi:hypothetical protein